MKLLRFGPPGLERPGLLDDAGMIRDLSGHIADINGATIGPEALARLSAIDPKALPAVSGSPRLGVPVANIGKYIAIGLNYADHAAESNLPVPAEPVLFTKATSCLNGPNDDVMLPLDSRKGDWEVELGVIIGRTARSVTPGQALEYVSGYVLANDVSERQWQLERGVQWDKGKGFDTFGPVGPWLVTADEIRDPQDINLFLDLNGRRMQTGNTRTMIFPVAHLISYVSTCMTLLPGDLLITGTPPGVGMGKKPTPLYLKPGDVMKVGSDRLGHQQQRVVAWRSPHAGAAG